MTGMLVMVPSVHVVVTRDGQMWMDDKFVAGLHLFAREWGGPTRVILRKGTGLLPFSSPVTAADLPGDLRLIDENAAITADDLRGATVVLGTADDHRQLNLAPLCADAGARLVYAIEYPLQTRLAVARLDLARRPMKLARTVQWLLMQELRLRRALRSADGVQANGFPAMQAYGGLNGNMCLYLDNRSDRGTMATPPEMQTRAAWRGPLRIVHAGRLIAMKGTQDLIPTAIALRDSGVEFRMDIFGAGDMRQTIIDDLARHALDGTVQLHEPIDFAIGLVPWMRRNADLFLAPHRQSDPSCSYLEAMGCGVPVLGTDNRMWSELARQSGGGWVMPMGNPDRAAGIIAGLDRAAIAKASASALKFAQSHDFHSEFRRRIDHLRQVAALPG
ncbi:glycosyltransferase [Paracoccus sp. Ld10]|uniref:glycosyltransferase n=1 Tax=Paracoccus sp. Ld10 TaxID=649158 RepID=UPI0038693CC8